MKPPLHVQGCPVPNAKGLLLLLLLLHGLAARLVLGQESQHAAYAAGKEASLLEGQCLPTSCVSKRTYWDHMLHHVPPCIAVKNVWWSKMEPRLPITLVTQLSINRLPALQAQCKAWAGPLAAAVYVPLFNPGPQGEKDLSLLSKQRLQAAVSAAEQVFNWAEELAAMTKSTALKLSMGTDTDALLLSTGRGTRDGPAASCQLRIMLVYEVFAQEKAMALYPVNQLRNYARLLSDTPLIANIDVDMLPSLSLSAALLRDWFPSNDQLQPAASLKTSSIFMPGSAGDLLSRVAQEKAVFVVPAFETTCGGPRFAEMASRYNKHQIQDVMAKNCTSIFRHFVAPQCHNATNFDHWFSLPSVNSDATVPYRVQYEDSFEPWFISARAQTEWFDVRYRGYGKNKIQQVAHTAHRHTAFYVHPTGYIIHRPHDQSHARKAFLRVKFKSKTNLRLLQDSLYQHVESMWETHFKEIKAGKFQALVDDTLADCLSKVPWWKDVYGGGAPSGSTSDQ